MPLSISRNRGSTRSRKASPTRFSENAVMAIDLETQTISRPDGEKVKFEVGAFRKHCLLNGLDDIGLTEQKAAEIAGYEERARLARPWQFGMIRPGA